MLDLDEGQVQRDAATTLSPLEVRLLRTLAAHAPAPVSNEELLRDVFGYAPTAKSRTVRVTVGRLRRKLETDPSEPKHLLTVRGAGYRLVAAPVRDAALHPPAMLDPLLGRDELLATIHASLAERRWVTLEGPPGIGKTRLALEVAHDWSGPVAWFELEPSATLTLALGHVAGRLGVRLGTATALGDALADRVDLVVLDGVEHLVEELMEVAEAWMQHTSLRVLATSRRVVGVSGERRVEVGSLPEGAARALLVDRSGRPESEVTAVLDPCDGLPLALELAAASLRGVGAGRGEGAGGLSGSLARSWSLLAAGDRRALVACTAFAGAFAPEEAADVLGEGSLSHLHTLRSHGLLARRGPRLVLLRSLGEAVQQISVEGREEAWARHIEAFGRRASTWREEVFGPGRQEVFDAILDRRREIETAMLRAIASDPRRAAGMLKIYAYAVRLRVGERVDAWYERLLPSAQGHEPWQLEVRCAWLQLDVALGAPAKLAGLQEVLDQARAGGHLEVVGTAMSVLGRALVLLDRHDEARALFEEAVTLPLPPRHLARAWLGLAKVARQADDGTEERLDRAREALGELPDPLVAVELELSRGRVALDRGDLPRARACFEAGLALARADGDYAVATPLSALATLAMSSGDTEAARGRLHDLVALHRRLGMPRGVVVAMVRVAMVAVEAGHEDAREQLEAAQGAMGSSPAPAIQTTWLRAALLHALEHDDPERAALEARLRSMEPPPVEAALRDVVLAMAGWCRGEAVPPDAVPAAMGPPRWHLLSLVAARGDRAALGELRRTLPRQGANGPRGVVELLRGGRDLGPHRSRSVWFRLVERFRQPRV